MEKRDAVGWLGEFEELIRGRAGRGVMEVGCGAGEDLKWLRERGIEGVGFDLAEERLRVARGLGVRVFRGDLTRPWAAADGSVGVVVASLSLHYFRWAVTVRVMREVGRVLGPDGVLVFRVNASDDVEFGAGEGVEVEPGLFRVAGRKTWSAEGVKRFFTEGMVREMVASGGMRVAALRHEAVGVDGRVKRVWVGVGMKC